MGIFTSENEFVGVDIGSTALRIVQIKKDSGRNNLIAFASVPIPGSISRSDSKLDMQTVAQIIKNLFETTKISTKSVVTSLPTSSVFSTIIKMPPMSKGELAKAVKFQAEQNIPLKIEDVRFDWQVVRENPITKETAVMIVAAPKTKTERMLELFEMAGKQVVYLETSAIAVARALSQPNDPLTMILDIGAIATELTIIENGVVSHVRSLPSAGFALTRSVSQSLGLDIEQAEQFKIRFGLSENKLEGQVFRAMEPVLTNVIEEIRRSLKFYLDQFGGALKKIVLTGGGSCTPEILSYLRSELNIEVVQGDPWTNIVYDPNLKGELNENAFTFACAVGLAKREN